MKIASIDALQLPSGNTGATTRGAWSPVLISEKVGKQRSFDSGDEFDWSFYFGIIIDFFDL